MTGRTGISNMFHGSCMELHWHRRFVIDPTTITYVPLLPTHRSPLKLHFYQHTDAHVS